MARRTEDREDLLREATAYKLRAEWTCADGSHVYFWGMRASGATSLYVDAEPVFQFNSDGLLRRLYWDGRMVKAENGRLVELERNRVGAEVRLERLEWDDDRLAGMTGTFVKHHADVLRALKADEVEWRGAIPATSVVLEAILAWTENVAIPVEIAATAHAQ